MIRIGITGGIGSGKTTVAKTWEQMGAEICQADRLARELMESDPEIIREVRETFGDESYRENGTLNREHLAREAFEKGRVDRLNAIVHPRVPRAVYRKIREAEERGKKVFVYEAALLPSEEKPDFVDYLVMVRAPEASRMRRVAERDQTSPEHVRRRAQNQPDFVSLEHLADEIIVNDGTLAELREKARSAYRRLAGDPS